MVTCTECGGEIEAGTKYIAGIRAYRTPHGNEKPKRDLVLFWACEHCPAEDAEVRLASKECVESFCLWHPELIETIVGLLSQYQDEDAHQLIH